ncbi:MAG: four-helix bundle copper-binding protein [Micromonosporaceae bacterium]|jgi:hypothetical protein
MTQAQAMLETYPSDIWLDRRLLAEGIATVVECSQTCTACADACLNEPDVADLTSCIRENLDCADICDVTGRVLSRHTGDNLTTTQAVLQACVAACRSCGDECARYAERHAHCRVTADECRRCLRICEEMLAAIA